MQFTLLTLLFSSALAAPILDSVDLDRVVDLDDTSLNLLSVDTSAIDGAIASAPEKKRQVDIDGLVDLDNTDLNVLSVDTSAVDGVIAAARPESKRQAQPVVDIVHGLLETVAPVAEQIGRCLRSKTRLHPSKKTERNHTDPISPEDALTRLAGTDIVEGLTDLVAKDVGGLLTGLVSEVESVVDNLAGAATGSDKDDLAEIVGEVLKLVDGLVQDVEGTLGGVGKS